MLSETRSARWFEKIAQIWEKVAKIVTKPKCQIIYIKAEYENPKHLNVDLNYDHRMSLSIDILATVKAGCSISKLFAYFWYQIIGAALRMEQHTLKM